MVRARAVSFLIADFSGNAVVRFGRAEPGSDTADPKGGRDLENVQLAGTVYERVLRTKQVDMEETADGTCLTAPVTDRGDAIGVLELTLTRHPDDGVIADIAAVTHALAYVVGSLRNGRRRGLDLAEQATNANDALAAISEPGQFVTGQVMRVDLNSGLATIVNAGHPLPLRLRHGSVEEIEPNIDFPFGTQAGNHFRVQQFPLAPGDRIIFVTDGMFERNAAELDLSASLRLTGDLHPREAVHDRAPL